MADFDLVTALPLLSPRPRDSHKGTYGRVLIVAGAPGMSGAAVLAGHGALRGGAGLVQVATPASIQSVVAGSNPCYLTTGLPTREDGSLSAESIPIILDLAHKADVLAVGPGLGQSREITLVVSTLLKQVNKPVVLDADGLNALAHLLVSEAWQPRTSPLICTPHPGEFARLLSQLPQGIPSDRVSLALHFARTYQIVLVLKGHETIVTDGQQLHRNRTGNPGMATGGTGDVLTGLIAALVGQHLSPFAAAQLGTYLHGLAGDLIASELGEISLTALDLVEGLPKAFQHYTRESASR